MSDLQEDKLEISPERNAGRIFIFIFCFALFVAGIYAFGYSFIAASANIWYATAGLLAICVGVFVAFYYPESKKN